MYSQHSLVLLHLRRSPELEAYACAHTRSTPGVASAAMMLKPRTLGLMRWWLLCAGCLVYLFGISGGMFNILRNNVHFPPDFWRQSWRQRLNVWKYINEGDSHDQS